MKIMKYIITDTDEIVMGANTYHVILKEHAKGKVVAAGHCEMDGNTCIKVFGKSIGYGIESKPSDKDFINSRLVRRVANPYE